MDKIKLVLLSVLMFFIVLAFWQIYTNNKLDMELQQLEIEKALKDQEVQELRNISEKAKLDLQAFETEADAKLDSLHKENEELQNKIVTSEKRRQQLGSEILSLEEQLASIPPTPPEIVKEHCPELPIVQAINVKLKEDIVEANFQLAEKDNVIRNKDIEISIHKENIGYYATYAESQEALVRGLTEDLAISEEQVKTYKKKTSSRWIPRPFVGVAGTCSVSGTGCMFGPSVGLGWNF